MKSNLIVCLMALVVMAGVVPAQTMAPMALPEWVCRIAPIMCR